MNKLFVPAVAVFALGWGPLLAQERVVRGAEPSIQKDTYRVVSNDESFAHGTSVQITRKTGSPKVSGVLVYADPKVGCLYVRPGAGQAPVAVALNEIQKIDRIAPALDRSVKDGVRPAIEIDARPRSAYEIHELQIRNGPYTKVHFYESSLSPSERELLRTISRTSADVEAKGLLVDSLSRAIQEAVTDLTVPALPIISPAYFPPDAYQPPFVLVANSSMTNPVIVPGYTGGVLTAAPAPRPDSLAELMKRLSEAEAALAMSRKNYEAACSRAIYEPGGRIIAVRLDD
jgi:hypothetical protein